MPFERNSTRNTKMGYFGRGNLSGNLSGNLPTSQGDFLCLAAAPASEVPPTYGLLRLTTCGATKNG